VIWYLLHNLVLSITAHISLVTTLVFSFWYNRCVLTASDTALADTMATSGRINNDDSDEHNGDERRRRATATADTAATSGHVDNNSNKQDVHDDDQDKDKADTTTTRQLTGITPTTMNTTTAMYGITVVDTMTTRTAGTTRTSGFSDIYVAPPAIPTSIVAQPRRGPIAFLEERAALISQRASEAAAVAREAVTDAADFNNVHASIVAKHRKMFLGRAFGITSDGTVTIELKKEFKSVKTYEKYTAMIHVISNWGDDDVLKEASSDNPVASAIRKFCKSNTRGYNFVRDFKIEVSETLHESQRWILKHKKSGGIVSHMLNIFEIINKANSRQGHLKAEKTLANMQRMHYSPTLELCKLFCLDCFVCHERHPNVPPTKHHESCCSHS